jgi:hypothetical protein
LFFLNHFSLSCLSVFSFSLPSHITYTLPLLLPS